MTDWTPCHRVEPHPMHADDPLTGRGCPGVYAEVGPAERLAQRFHETYERLAPSHGYETRKASAKPWADVPEPNRSLMIEVAAELLATWPAAEAGRADDDGGDVLAATQAAVDKFIDESLATAHAEGLAQFRQLILNGVSMAMIPLVADHERTKRKLAEVSCERDKARAKLARIDLGNPLGWTPDEIRRREQASAEISAQLIEITDDGDAP